MADDRDSSQQTEEPTQRRLDEAREHGDVVKSGELVTFIVLGGGALAIAIFGRSTSESLTLLLRGFLENPDQIALDSGDIMALMRHVLIALGTIFVGPFLLMIAASLAGHLVQGSPTFTTARMALDLSKLSPLAGLGRIFGVDGWVNLGKGLIKIVIVGAVIWAELWPERNHLEAILGESPVGVASDMTRLLFKVATASLAVLALIAAADYFFQRQRFLQRNRMSKQEIREEFRQNEGDPTVKARIRQIRQERARRRIIAAVPTATVVVTNPTHFAVALKYESGKMEAPVCVAKGVDALALKIREVAEENDVPIVENPPLARALHASVEIDEEIPPEHYKAVAQVIGYVMRLNGTLKN